MTKLTTNFEFSVLGEFSDFIGRHATFLIGARGEHPTEEAAQADAHEELENLLEDADVYGGHFSPPLTDGVEALGFLIMRSKKEAS